MREPNDVFPSTGRPRRRRRRQQGLAGVAAGLLILGTTLVGTASPAAAHQHGTEDGHLIGTGAEGKIEFVDKVEVSGAGPELIADVAVDPDADFAYLANWGSPDCPILEAVPGNEAGGRKASDAGVWVVDISDLDNPIEVAFIPMSQDTRPGEGMQVLHIATDEFTGDVLAVNEESCGKNFKA